jgi:hypothetical protein
VSLSIAQKFTKVCPAPILHLHRHEDGYISFAVEREGDDFRPLVAIKAGELETWFPFFQDQLLKDSYCSINADWRLRKCGPHGNAYGYPLHRSDRLTAPAFSWKKADATGSRWESNVQNFCPIDR